MDLRRLTDTIFVAPQIDIADLPRLADEGFTTLIDNRPDGEIEAALQSAREPRFSRRRPGPATIFRASPAISLEIRMKKGRPGWDGPRSSDVRLSGRFRAPRPRAG